MFDNTSTTVKYVVVTPARNEEQHIQTTILAVTEQTLRPAQWVIVNDGSSDRTGAIVDDASKAYPWITPLHRSNRGFRQSGGGVIAAFNDGFACLKVFDWDFIVKLDADLGFAPDYFERCFAEFRKDPNLGIGGGGIYHLENGSLTLEPGPIFHVRGATKIYKRQCWEMLGGLVIAPGWDTVDELRANMLGWSTRTFVNLQVSHFRFTGSAEGSWKDSVKNGFANYIAGYHPFFMFVKCLRRVMSRPYVVGSVGLGWGFLKGYIQQAARVDRTLIKYTRKQQIRRLLCLSSIWR